jgi:FkbM family methyltransferase
MDDELLADIEAGGAKDALPLLASWLCETVATAPVLARIDSGDRMKRFMERAPSITSKSTAIHAGAAEDIVRQFRPPSFSTEVFMTMASHSNATKPLSYCQNLEDYHLWLALGGEGRGFYIDVGGGHPVADNVSLWFYERGWHGLVIEPQTALANLYAHTRPRDTVYEGLIGREVRTAEFHTFPRLHGLSTTVSGAAEASKVLGDTYDTVSKPMLTLETLCETYGVTEIDFLKVDVEGAEADVLAGNDWTRFRPKVVLVEAIDPVTNRASHEAWEADLLGAGYAFRLDDTLNRFYVANECPEVLQRLPAERGDWDAVTHMYEIGRAPENANHPDHLLACELARGLWASLPTLDGALIAQLLERGRGVERESSDAKAIAQALGTEEFKIALGRIACGYDGGQIV